MLIHGAADIHQQQHFHIVVALGHHFDVQVTRIGCGGSDGVVQVQLFFVAFPGKLSQPAQRHFDVASAQFLGVVVVLVGALVPDFDRALVAALVLTNPDALRVLPKGAKGAGATGADPLAAALVPFLLLFKTLFEGFHEFVPAHLFNFGALLGAQVEFEVFAQPFERNVPGEVGDGLHALEVAAKGTVKLVVILLVLHQCGAAEVVKIVNLVACAVGAVQRCGCVRTNHALLQGFEQRQKLLDRHG